MCLRISYPFYCSPTKHLKTNQPFNRSSTCRNIKPDEPHRERKEMGNEKHKKAAKVNRISLKLQHIRKANQLFNLSEVLSSSYGEDPDATFTVLHFNSAA